MFVFTVTFAESNKMENLTVSVERSKKKVFLRISIVFIGENEMSTTTSSNWSKIGELMFKSKDDIYNILSRYTVRDFTESLSKR